MEQEIEDVNEFTYLGANVCKHGGGMKDLRNRLSKSRGGYTKRWYNQFCCTVLRPGR